MTESQSESGPPAGFETKNTPGSYTPAAVVSGDHPGHAVGFAGKPGYTNTPGIEDPAENADAKSTSKTSTTKSTTATPAK